MKHLMLYVFLWLLGFPALVLFDLFVEFVLFEQWNLNYTTKNDIFFVTWWLVVLSWGVFGIRFLYTVWKKTFNTKDS